MKTAVEIENKLEEALNMLDAIPSWETEDMAACEGAVAALTWVLGGLENFGFDEEAI